MHNSFKQKFKFLIAFTVVIITIIVVLNSAIKIFYPLKYKDIVFRYSKENDLDPYLIFSIIKAESSFNPNATSYRNARGLMQITEETGKWGASVLGIKDFTKECLYDPDINIRIGCWYLRVLMKEFNEDMDLVITAYNAGSGNVSKWLDNFKYSETGTSLKKIPFRETERYLKRVKGFYSVYKGIYE